MSMTNVSIREIEELQITNKPIIQAFAGSGMVASIAAYHLIETLGLKEKGYIQVKGIPSLVTVKDGLIQQPLRLYESDELGLVLCDISIPQERIEDVIYHIMCWYKTKDVSWVVVIGGLPTNRRSQGASVQSYGVCNNATIRKQIEEKQVKVMSNGAVYGSIAYSLLEATNLEIPCLAILGECIATIPDYSATLAVLDTLTKCLDLEFSTEKLNESASQLDEKILSQLSEFEEQEAQNKSDSDTQYI